MRAPESYGLRSLRRAASSGYAVTVYPHEAADIITEVEHLRAEVAAAKVLRVPYQRLSGAADDIENGEDRREEEK